MAKIAKNLTELIGRTPLMELAEYRILSQSWKRSIRLGV